MGKCFNGGFCDDKNGICQCPNGTLGEFCESFEKKPELNEFCGKNCSEHGICINSSYCFCDIRFEGRFCEIQIRDVEVINCKSQCYEVSLRKFNGVDQCIKECLTKKNSSSENPENITKTGNLTKTNSSKKDEEKKVKKEKNGKEDEERNVLKKTDKIKNIIVNKEKASKNETLENKGFNDHGKKEDDENSEEGDKKNYFDFWSETS